jgi:hypothetical protein
MDGLQIHVLIMISVPFLLLYMSTTLRLDDGLRVAFG